MLNRLGKKMFRNAPKDVLEGILDLVEAPPKRLFELLARLRGYIDKNVDEDDRKRILDVLRTSADLYIKYGSKAAGGKINF